MMARERKCIFVVMRERGRESEFTAAVKVFDSHQISFGENPL